MNYDNCEVCGMPLLQRGGFAGLGMCGPCVTGDADTIDEVCEPLRAEESEASDEAI